MNYSVFLQVIVFTSDGKVKQNRDEVSLPYYSGASDRNIFFIQDFPLSISA